MKHVLFLLLIFTIIRGVYSQDSCQVNKYNFGDITGRITEYFHESGVISHRYIIKSEFRYTSREWDSCGRFIRKTKSRKVKNKKISYYKISSIEYKSDDRIKTKRRYKTRGCKHIKKSSRIRYSQDGNRFKRLKTIGGSCSLLLDKN